MRTIMISLTILREHDPGLVWRDKDFKDSGLVSAGADARGVERTPSAGVRVGRGQHIGNGCATERAVGKLRFRHLYDTG